MYARADTGEKLYEDPQEIKKEIDNLVDQDDNKAKLQMEVEEEEEEELLDTEIEEIISKGGVINNSKFVYLDNDTYEGVKDLQEDIDNIEEDIKGAYFSMFCLSAAWLVCI